MKAAVLGDIADWGSGGTPKRGVVDYFGVGVPWLSIADLNDRVVHRAKESLTPAGIANSSAKIVPPGTIFVAMYGSIGKLGIAGTEMCTSQAIAFAKPRLDKVDRRFLFHFLLAQRPALQSLGRGGTQMNIGQADLKAWPIRLPNLEEQRRIAATLDHADALRAKRRQVLARLDTLTQSIFHDMFADSPDDLVPIGSFAEVRSGSTPSRDDPDNYGGDIPWVKTGELQGRLITQTAEHVTERGMASARLRLFPEGSVVIAMYGQGKTRGQSAILGMPATTNQACAVIAPTDAFVPTFLQAQLALAYQRLRGEAEGGNQPNLSLGRVAGFGVLLPRVAEQQAFAARIRQVNVQRAWVRGALAAADELFASLQSRAFRGEL